MARSAMNSDARRRLILECIKNEGKVRVKDIAQASGASLVTIRSDLAALERDGDLQRVSGGAVQTVRNFYSADFRQRNQLNAQYKRRIAEILAGLIHNGETLFINSGTTTGFVAEQLVTRRNLNIVTNSLSVAMTLASQPTFRVILLGGELNTQYAFTYGSDALEQLRHYKADKAILSIDGVHTVAGLTTYHAEEAVIDRAMIARARETIIAADHNKLGYESFSFVAEVNEASQIVTDEMADDEQVAALKACGLSVLKEEKSDYEEIPFGT